MIYINLKRDGDLVFAAQLHVNGVVPVTRVFADADIKPYEMWQQADKDALKAELLDICQQQYPEILEGAN